jgi:hypothetical protein
MAQGIQNGPLERGEEALVGQKKKVVELMESGRPLLDVARELGVITAKDTAEAKILDNMTDKQEAAIRKTVLDTLNADDVPEYNCKITDPARHAASGKGVKVAPRGKVIDIDPAT